METTNESTAEEAVKVTITTIAEICGIAQEEIPPTYLGIDTKKMSGSRKRSIKKLAIFGFAKAIGKPEKDIYKLVGDWEGEELKKAEGSAPKVEMTLSISKNHVFMTYTAKTETRMNGEEYIYKNMVVLNIRDNTYKLTFDGFRIGACFAVANEQIQI